MSSIPGLIPIKLHKSLANDAAKETPQATANIVYGGDRVPIIWQCNCDSLSHWMWMRMRMWMWMHNYSRFDSS